MKIIRVFAVSAALALLLSACNEGAEEGIDDKSTAAPTTQTGQASTSQLPVEPGPDAVLPSEVAADAVTVGNAVADDRAVKAAQARFATGDTVYASALAKGKPGANVAVYWTYQDGTTHKEESRALGASNDVVTFSFASGDGMVPGKYNVQIDVDMIPVGISDFVIQ